MILNDQMVQSGYKIEHEEMIEKAKKNIAYYEKQGNTEAVLLIKGKLNKLIQQQDFLG